MAATTNGRNHQWPQPPMAATINGRNHQWPQPPLAATTTDVETGEGAADRPPLRLEKDH
jgi:hypothetical protein